MARLLERKRFTFQNGEYTLELIDTCYQGRSDERAQDDFNTWKHYPRGLCTVLVRNPLGITTHRKTLFGLAKFTYDDHPKYLKELGCQTIYQKYYMTKENGECCHISAFKYGNMEYWIVGSKNVHILLQRKNPLQDMTQYTDQQYTFAIAMAKQIFSNSKIMFEQLFTYLSENDYTFCIESCRRDSLHIISYEDPRIFLYAITSSKSQGITVMTPIETGVIAEQFGLDAVQCSVVNVNNVSRITEVENEILLRNNSEGAVVYISALDVASQREVIVWSYKYKSNGYVFWRAVREIMKCHYEFTVGLSKIARLRQTHPEIVNIDMYIRRGKQLYTYWYQDLKMDETYCGTKYPQLINQFNNDDNTLPVHDVPLSTQKKMAIILKGVPCSGKTTIGKIIESRLNGQYIDQDMFGGDRNRFVRHLKQLVDHEQSVIVIGKSHFTKKQRADTVKCLTSDYQVYFIELQYTGTHQQFASMIKDRLTIRGNNHSTLKPDCPDIDVLIRGFITSMSSLDDDELHKYHCIRIDMMLPVETIVQQILTNIVN
jgi:adenylate kinase family enzyme